MYALITHHDPGYQPLADLTWHSNKMLYASIHGYKTHARLENFATLDAKSGLMTGFEKIYFARDILRDHPEYEWIWWTGTDSMITNFSTKIEDKIDNNYHFIVAVDVNGINADSFLVRNTPEGRGFLDQVIALEDESMKFWDTEQRAMNAVLGFPGTSEPGWPFGDQLKVPEQFQSIVKIVPQRYMNGYNYKFYHYTDHRDKLGIDGNWQPGDWLIHWPAIGLPDRVKLFAAYKPYIEI